MIILKRILFFISFFCLFSGCSKLIVKDPYSSTNKAMKIFQWESADVDGIEILVLKNMNLHQIPAAYYPAKQNSHIFYKKINRKESDYEYFIQKIHGRGEIKIIEQPNSKNDFSVVISVDDNTETGKAPYKFELYRREK